MSLPKELESLAMEECWKTEAIERQNYYFDTLGLRPYDEIEKTNLFLLKKLVGFATCGAPDELPSPQNNYIGYNNKKLDSINLVCKKIVEKSDLDPVRFTCIMLVLRYKKQICETPVIRIETTSGNVFIDSQARVYTSWTQFMKDNKLPDCEYCYPVNSEYNRENRNVEFAFSPASELFQKTLDHLDTVGSIAAIGAIGVTAVASAPAVLVAAGATAVCTGIYGVARSFHSLSDRKKHDQSINVKDKEARAAWLNIAASAACASSVAALRGAAKIVESGKTLSKASILGIKALGASSVAISGFGFVESLVTCVDEYSNGTLTKKHVFDASCEALFLFCTIKSVKATNKLLSSMNAAIVENPSVQKKLTRTQKRNLLKRNAKRRAKGLAPVNPRVTLNQPERNSNVSAEDEALKSNILSANFVFKALRQLGCINPRLEKLLNALQSVCHDIQRYKSEELSFLKLAKNVSLTAKDLYNYYSKDINESEQEIKQCLKSLNISKVLEDLFESAQVHVKKQFSTVITNLEDRIETLLTEAKQAIQEFYKCLKLKFEHSDIDDPEDTNIFDDDSEDDGCPEAHHFFEKCGHIIEKGSLPHETIEDIAADLEVIKYELVTKFKEKIENYKKCLKAAKSVSGDSFALQKYHVCLGIQGDVTQYYFDLTLKELANASSIRTIKTKFLRKRHYQDGTAMVTPALEDDNGQVFISFGAKESGKMTDTQVLSLVKNISNASVAIKIVKVNGFYLIKILGGTNSNDKIAVAVTDLTDENTASVMTFILN